jgi:hypothetical protein
MFTRFHDDPARIRKQAEIASFSGRYALETPGQGVDLPFFEDPHMRMQQWGANLCTNTVNLESDLRGMTRLLNRDYVDANEYRRHAVASSGVRFSSAAPFVQESRASHPAWTFRAVTHDRWEAPLQNPQANLERSFSYDVQTRILARDMPF